MNQDKLHKYMDFMMNAQENMVIQMFGNISLNYLITFLLQLLLIVKYYSIKNLVFLSSWRYKSIN